MLCGLLIGQEFTSVIIDEVKIIFLFSIFCFYFTCIFFYTYILKSKMYCYSLLKWIENYTFFSCVYYFVIYLIVSLRLRFYIYNQAFKNVKAILWTHLFNLNTNASWTCSFFLTTVGYTTFIDSAEVLSQNQKLELNMRGSQNNITTSLL